MNTQCIGTTKQNLRCRVSWGLDEHSYCEQHQYQYQQHQDANANARRNHCCLGIKSDGTRCKISWDLDPNSRLCKYHMPMSNVRPTQPPAPVTKASPIRPPHSTSLATSIIEGADTKTSSSSATTVSTASPPSTETPSPDTGERSSLSFPPPTEEWPPLWTVQYIVETRTVVIRMLSEWSWQCNHKPIILIVPWWSKFDIRPVRNLASALFSAGNLLARCLVGSSVGESTRAAMYPRADAVKEILKVLIDMGIFNDGGLYESSDSKDLDDLSRLKGLLDQYDPKLKSCASQLKCVKLNNQDPIWVSREEAGGTLHDMKRQPKPLTKATMQFERVSGKGYNTPKQNGRITIEWWLTNEMSGESIEHGFACIKEPIPLTKLSRAKLAHCVLRVKVHQREIGKEIGEGKIELKEGRFIAHKTEDGTISVAVKDKQQQQQGKVYLCFLAESSKE